MTAVYLLESDLFKNIGLDLGKRNSYLLHRVSVTNGHTSVILGVKVVGDAEGRSDLILAAISLTDRARLVEVGRELLRELVVKLESLVGKLL